MKELIHNWPYLGSKLIANKDLKPYLKRNNINGLIHLILHLSLILCSGFLIYFFKGSSIQYLLMIIHGIFIAFLYAGLHECIHKTAFKNKKLNEIIGFIIGFIILRSFLNARFRHMAHHTFTQHPEKDPDKVNFPRGYFDYFKHITSITIWIRIVDNLIRHSLGKINKFEDEYIPQSGKKLLIKETRLMFLGYLLVLIYSLYLNSIFFLVYWLIPRMLGEPFVRLVRMVEHTGKDETPDMIHNTRTSFPSKLLKFLYWNMPYHLEHHLYANVPFYRLPEFHKLIKPYTDKEEPSILHVHIEILKQIWVNKKSKIKKNSLQL
jgi:fatty acid desaturase